MFAGGCVLVGSLIAHKRLRRLEFQRESPALDVAQGATEARAHTL